MIGNFTCPQCGAEYDDPGTCDACQVALKPVDDADELEGFQTDDDTAATTDEDDEEEDEKVSEEYFALESEEEEEPSKRDGDSTGVSYDSYDDEENY